ncbi:DUF2087 domain-containing protein [Bacillus marasmi]|uniref:DUF2087 domain-containing protein n=1 Tax=Bacillus marasmi TaxID=1926279 RepID=UPI0011CA65C4|nr:DUF2087 domain-containing protein [Bacillus marasmi]
MEQPEIFWNADISELKRGYYEEKEYYVCLLCGERIEKGVIYPSDNVLYEAEKYMKLHIYNVHGSVFDYLISLNKKLTGLTDHQNRLLHLFYQGKNDAEIQKEMGIGSASTIRNHRFVLKEKERQAKMFLTMMELLKEKDEHAPTLLAPHKTATMIDERYNVTSQEKEEILAKFFPEGTDGSLKTFPKKEKHKLVILQEITKRLKRDYLYSEKQLNEIIKPIFEDFVTIRRYLIEYGFIDRKLDGSQYWIKH